MINKPADGSCGMSCLNNVFGDKIFNIALEKSGHKRYWNRYKP